MKKLLIVVDMQNDFLFGALGTPEARSILPAVRGEIASARARGVQVVYTRDTHARDYLKTQEGKRLPVPHCEQGTPGWEIVEGLYDGGEIFDKPSFGSVALAEYAKAGGYDDVELVGVCTDICVISNALLLKAFCPEARVWVRAAACAGATREGHENALAAMRACQVDVV